MRGFLLRRLLAALVIAPFLFCGPPAVAGGKDKKPAAKQPISKEAWYYLVHDLVGTVAYAQAPFPRGEKGLTIKPDGEVVPNAEDLRQMIADNGYAAKSGDRVIVTGMSRQGKTIVLELNGGPKKKKKWYQRIQVCGAGACTSPGTAASTDNPESKVNLQGSVLTLEFRDYIPEMMTGELKKILAPALDFSSISPAEAYLKAIPAKASEAIKNHRVLVGMDIKMVRMSIGFKGLPPKVIHDTDEAGNNYEEWIYGAPPEDVWFIRFLDGYVSRLEVMKVSGEKTVITERVPEIDDYFRKQGEAVKAAEAAAPALPAKRPTLRRPGEDRIGVPQGPSNPMPPCKQGENKNCTPPPPDSSPPDNPPQLF